MNLNSIKYRLYTEPLGTYWTIIIATIDQYSFQNDCEVAIQQIAEGATSENGSKGGRKRREIIIKLALKMAF